MVLAVTSLSLVNAVAGNNYKVDDTAIDQLFEQSVDVSYTANEDFATLNSENLTSNLSSVNAAGEKTVGGFLIRAWFCGGFALHRYYMGTGGKQLFWYYFCIPVVGGVTGCVDFWWVVFKGQEALSKYADNPKFIVWSN